MSSSGSTKKTRDFLLKVQSANLYSKIEPLAREGVVALAAATPLDSGLTASSWDYVIEIKSGVVFVNWINTNKVDGVPVAILLQYGHGTGTGGWVQGYDYINPAIRPIMDKIANEIWKQVTSA